MIDLPINNNYNTILILVNYLIKEKHYILYIINEIVLLLKQLLFQNI